MTVELAYVESDLGEKSGASADCVSKAISAERYVKLAAYKGFQKLYETGASPEQLDEYMAKESALE